MNQGSQVASVEKIGKVFDTRSILPGSILLYAVNFVLRK